MGGINQMILLYILMLFFTLALVAYFSGQLSEMIKRPMDYDLFDSQRDTLDTVI